jgi:hypothetical protein
VPINTRRAIAEHLESRDVARVIYGTVVGLALVVALQGEPLGAGETAGIVAGTALAVGMAELYSDLVGTEARSHHPVDRMQVRSATRNAGAAVFGAGFPALFFATAATGIIALGTAFTVAKWSGFGLLFVYGFVAGRASGSGYGRALAHGAAVGAIGGVLIVIKALLHH